MQVEYKDMPALRVAAVRHQGPYHQISEAFARLGQVAASGGLQDAAGAMLAIYYDDPTATPVAELRSEAGLVVSAGTAIPPGLVEVEVPAGRYAVTTYQGPYEFLGEVWAKLREQVATKEGQPPRRGPSYEIYRNTPETAPPGKLLTELHLPVANSASAISGNRAR